MPNNPEAYSNKAEAFLTMGAFDDALKAADEGLKHAPTDASLWCHKARALESLLKIQEAVGCYNEALKYNSSDPETWKALALCLDAEQKWSEVARAYRIAAGLHKKRGEGHEAESCLKFAKMAESSSDAKA
jgi:tetratricopeptide (TPR) repeat protein